VIVAPSSVLGDHRDMGGIRGTIGTWFICAVAQAAAGCIGDYPDCETEEAAAGEHDPQPDGLTPAAFMEGLEGQRVIELQWSGRNEELGLSFELPAHAETGSLVLAPMWATARQLEAGSKPCGRRSIVVDFAATLRTDDGVLDYTFDFLAQQLGDERELRGGAAAPEALEALELHDPMPEQMSVTGWMLELRCTAEHCEGSLDAIVGGVAEPQPGEPASPPRVTIATWATRG
jgi:hypothetical protein